MQCGGDSGEETVYKNAKTIHRCDSIGERSEALKTPPACGIASCQCFHVAAVFFRECPIGGWGLEMPYENNRALV